MSASTPTRLRIPRNLYDGMVRQALAELPNECCGLLAGRVTAEGVGAVSHRFPLVNALASPTLFESEPRGLFEATRAMREREVEVLAVYHSHPTTEPVPSRRDRELNHGEMVVNLIISLRGERPEVRGWWVAADGVREAEWEVDV